MLFLYWLQKKKRNNVSSILSQHNVYELMRKSGTPNLPENLIFQKDGFT